MSVTSPPSVLDAITDVLSHKLGQEQSRQLNSEKDALLFFCQTFQWERDFSKLSYHQTVTKLFQLLLSSRLCDQWLRSEESDKESCHGDHVRCVLMTLRIILRDNNYQQRLIKTGPQTLQVLAKGLSTHAEACLHGSQLRYDSLKELANIFQKLSSCYAESVVNCVPEVVAWLVGLLRAQDLTLTQCCLCTLINICKIVAGVNLVMAVSPLPPLLHILQFYDPSSRRMTSDLLLLLASQSEQAVQCLKELDGLPLCLRLLHSEDLHILHRMVGVIERLCEDRELQDDFRLLGGVPLLLALLSKTADNSGTQDKLTALKSASCSAITQLSVNDTNARSFAQENGVYLLSKLVLPERSSSIDKSQSEGLQKNSWRALRYLYSSERNRRQFQRLFPPRLYEIFIDVGHYTRYTTAYTPLVQSVNSMTPSELLALQSAIEDTSTLGPPLFSVGGYDALELLGAGAFGNVYRVRKCNSDHFLAMKEIKHTLPLLGASSPDRASSIGKIMNEVNIIREQLQHPNVVLYHKCFEEGDHLYIIMELIEGFPLSDIIKSLEEKGERFEEERIWRIFTQLTLALRYLHKEKHVTHRDLKPSNLMVGETDKLTITDFGLAKQKGREFSVMQSTVGTLSYWCPELVRSESYTEKADIWAAGCILYQMATLHVPFQTTNILALAKKIAEVNYPPIPEGMYSPLLSAVVSRCLTADMAERPDSVALGGLLASQVMTEADRLAIDRHSLQHRLNRERQRTLRHQQRYRHLANLTTPPHNADRGRHEKTSVSFTAHPPLVTASPTSHSPTTLTRGTPSHTSHPPTNLQELHNPLETTGMDWGLTYSPVLFHRGSGMWTEAEVEWDGDSDMSENVFPETFPQPMTSPLSTGTSCHSDTFSEVETSPDRVKRENPLSLRTSRGRSYSAIVPGQLPRHHSGRGHGHIQRASTGSGRGLPNVGGAMAGSPSRYRRASTSSVLSLSSRHLREISDPISQLLSTLHRLLSLTLTTPTATHTHPARLLVLDRYQRSLFQASMSPAQIKGELHRLGTRSGEGVWLLEEGVWSIGPRLLGKALGEISAHNSTLALPRVTDTVEPCTLTYDLLATMIDSLHSEHDDSPLIT